MSHRRKFKDKKKDANKERKKAEHIDDIADAFNPTDSVNYDGLIPLIM